MSTNFPASIDNLANPTAHSSTSSVSHASQHANANDAIEAIQSYLIQNLPSSTTYVASSEKGVAGGVASLDSYGRLIVNQFPLEQVPSLRADQANINNLYVAGQLVFNGQPQEINTTNLTISDPMIYLGDSNPGNSLDLGIVSSYTDGSYRHTGLVRDASENKWKLFNNVSEEPGLTIDFSQASYDTLMLGKIEMPSNITLTSVAGGLTIDASQGINVQSANQAIFLYPGPYEDSGRFVGIAGRLDVMYGITAGGNISTTGSISATTYYGDGSHLTNIPSPISNPPLGNENLTLVSNFMGGYGWADAQKVVFNTVNSSYTPTLTDNHRMIRVSTAIDSVFTIPANTFSLGDEISVQATGDGLVTILGASGVTVESAAADAANPVLRTKFSSASIICVGSNTFTVIGDII